MSDDINIRSDEVREVMEKIPGWIIRWGTTLIFFIMALVIVGSYYLRYPTVIDSDIVVTTENPPASLVARASGRMSQIFVSDTQRVLMGQTIAIIENPANYNHVMQLKKQLARIDAYIISSKPDMVASLNADLDLGELQTPYANLLKQIYDYKNFVDLDFHQQKINSLKQEIYQYNSYINQLKNQIRILSDKVRLAQRQFKRDSILIVSGVISDLEFEKSRSNLLDQQYSLEQVQLSLSSTRIQVAGLKKQIVELQLEESETLKKMKTQLQESYNNLLAEIAKWELMYILKAPTQGIITFTKIWSENQFVKQGETVFTIIPERPGEIIGKIELPIKRSGKVKVDQDVNIKLDSYPYLEYGLVKGKVRNISLVPDGDNYIVEVNLPNGLVTFYGKELAFTQEMQGQAEIITEKLSLLRRIMNPIKYLIEKNIGDSY